MSDTRSCTCHPDDRPPVCQHLYAASECLHAWTVSERDRYRAALEGVMREADARGEHEISLIANEALGEGK